MNTAKIAIALSVLAIVVSAGGIGFLAYSLPQQVQANVKDLDNELKKQNDLLKLYGDALGIDTTKAKQIADARKEGKLVFYSDWGPETEVYARAFTQKYGIPVDLTQFAASAALAERVRTEATAGRNIVDVATTAENTGQIREFYQHFTKYDSAEAQAIKYKVPEGLPWTVGKLSGYTFGYAVKQVKAADVPKSWNDLLDPKWKGKILLRVPEHGATQSWVAWMLRAVANGDRAKWEDYMNKIALNVGGVTPSYVQLNQLVANGEYLIAIPIYPDWAEVYKGQGMPIEWGRPQEGVFGSTYWIGIATRAPHPNAAKLFMDFILSQEGQNLIASQNGMPAREGAEPTWYKTYVAAGGKYVYSPDHVVDIEKNRQTYLSKGQEFFGKVVRR